MTTASYSVADDFDEDAFAAVAVEFAVEDLFPGAEVEFAVGDGDKTSRPMIWRLRWASALSSPVRLWWY